MVGFLMRVRIGQGRVPVSVCLSIPLPACLFRAQRDRRAAQTCSLWAVQPGHRPQSEPTFRAGVQLPGSRSRAVRLSKRGLASKTLTGEKEYRGGRGALMAILAGTGGRGSRVAEDCMLCAEVFLGI